ncbi:tetratricopeptide repeat protein [Lysobacter sp. F6437]|uniref:tetratricopeptide repeat protein n=1 Tax=Lysobacter sp. F6437 TaxID=3459296 RepID=UPI00403D87C8
MIGIYWTSLSGAFLFDDYANLPAIGRYGPIIDGPSLLRYLTSGIADPTGRPVSMLSFLLDSRDWPADPAPFRRTNLLIHTANSLLLVAVLYRLGLRHLEQHHARWAALGGAALWATHPLWVSTVAYIVQRHAMLPVTFVLCAIVLWTYSQDAFERGEVRRGWVLALVAVGGFGLLAGLSKANGFLLPALLLALQLTVLRAPPRYIGRTISSRSFNVAVVGLLVLPTAFILSMLIWKGVSGWDTFQGRPWTVGQRLLTQPRVLLDYLGLLTWPRVHSPGLFADGFTASRGLMQPWTTLSALLIVLTLSIAAIVMRRNWPGLAACILFFFAGHLLESSSIQLELYFEHRNYLPALLLGWPVAIVLTRPGKARMARSALLLVVLAMLAGLTASRAALWGTPTQLALTWAKHLPASPRAQTNAALYEIANGQPRRAIKRLEPLLLVRPHEAQLALNLIDAECALGYVSEETIHAAEAAIMATGAGQDMVHKWMRERIEGSPARCEGLSVRALARLVAAAHRHQPQDATEQNRLAQLDGLLATVDGRCEYAVKQFNRGLEHERHAAQVFGQVGVLATRCGPTFGLEHLRQYRKRALVNDTPARSLMLRLHQRLLLHQGYWLTEMDRLEAVLADEAHSLEK